MIGVVEMAPADRTFLNLGVGRLHVRESAEANEGKANDSHPHGDLSPWRDLCRDFSTLII
jgi:hypothetical protein